MKKLASMGKKVRAAVLTEFNKPLTIQEFPLVKPEAEALIAQVSLATFCGTDVHIWKGELKGSVTPMILGHEAVGRIYELGKGVNNDSAGNPVEVGDRIIWDRILTCGRCYQCVARGNSFACVNRLTYGMRVGCSEPPYLNGFFSEYVYLRPRVAFFKIPEALDDEVVSPLNCAFGAVLNGLEKLQIKPGDKVVIQGAGPLGLYAVAVAREMGASKIISIDVVRSRLKLAEEFGADYTIDTSNYASAEERVKKVSDLTGGHGVDHVVEVTGSLEVIREGLEMLDSGGSYVIIGAGYAGFANISPSTLILKQLKVMGSLGHEPRHIEKGLRFIESRVDRYPFKKIISHTFRLDEVNAALNVMAKKEAIKAAIRFI
ncbi:MAG: zinc-binding dehydrogenase [Nitrososphaerales archaeon]